MQANMRVVFVMVQLQFFLTCNSSCRVGYFHHGKLCMLRDGVQRNVEYQNFPPPPKKDNNSNYNNNNNNFIQNGTPSLFVHFQRLNLSPEPHQKNK